MGETQIAAQAATQAKATTAPAKQRILIISGKLKKFLSDFVSKKQYSIEGN